MQVLQPDMRLADLVHLDVLDLRIDGSYALNAEFLAAARTAFEEDPATFDRVLGDLILARAMARGFALLDVDELALAALEVASADEEDARA